jgi:hypothetical protein
MNKSDLLKLGAALAVLAMATVLLVRFFRASDGTTDKTFFYDLSEKKLFTAARTAVPPIRGLNDAEADAVRAVVISTNGRPEDKRSWTVAYLEKYSPELKAQMESAQATGGSPSRGRGAALAHRFVRRIADTQWFAMDSPEAEKIVTEWSAPGPGGVTPVVCTP